MRKVLFLVALCATVFSGCGSSEDLPLSNVQKPLDKVRLEGKIKNIYYNNGFLYFNVYIPETQETVFLFEKYMPGIPLELKDSTVTVLWDQKAGRYSLVK